MLNVKPPSPMILYPFPKKRERKPIKKPKKGTLTRDQKIYNKKFSEMRVVVENTIRALKVFKVVRSVFRHWRGGQGQININVVMKVCVALTNRRLQKKNLRSPNWKASDWQEAFQGEREMVPTSKLTSKNIECRMSINMSAFFLKIHKSSLFL